MSTEPSEAREMTLDEYMAVLPSCHLARRQLAERDEELRQFKSELKKIQEQHECGCEFCSRSSEVCPATSSSYAMEILALHQQITALTRDKERLTAEFELAKHINGCQECAGPDDGCDIGQALEEAVINAKKEGA